MSFDWQTEDEIDWDEPERPSPSPPAQPRRRWPWVVLLGVLLAGTAVYLLYLELAQRVEVAAETVETDLLASYAVVQQAIRQQDRELLATFMSGRDPDWVQLQDQRVQNGRYYDRTLLAMQWMSTDMPQTPTVTLSDDLRSAELVTSRTYAIDIGNGLTETVMLEETAVYRLGPNRWLLSPPEPVFWGQEEQVEGQKLRITFPERDRALVQRLVLDIDTKLIELCAQFPDLGCPDNLRVQLPLVKEAGVLPGDLFAVLYSPSTGDLRLAPFPTPTALGVPVDEAGYQAMYRGYASQVVTAVIDALLDVDCCRERALYQAIHASYLQALSLQPWPVTAVHYQQSLHIPVEWAGLEQVWQMDAAAADIEAVWPAYALVDFLVTVRRTATRSQLMLSLQEFENGRYEQWLESIMPAQNSIIPDTQSWLRFVYDRSFVAQQPLPVPLPDQDIFMLCQTSLSANKGLYRYQFGQDKVTLVDRLPSLQGFLLALPDDNGMVVGERITNSNPASFYIWADGKKTTISWSGSSSETPSAAPIAYDPTGRKLLLSGTGTIREPFGLFDISGCLEDASCDIPKTDGFPIWSPDGTRSVVGVNYQSLDELQSSTLLFVGDESGLVLEATLEKKPLGWMIGNGYAPFWLNNNELGYLYDNFQSGRSTLALVDMETLESTDVLTAVDLLNVLPEANRPDWIAIRYANINPLNQDELLLVTGGTTIQSVPGHLFVYNRVTEQIETQFELLPEPRNLQRGYRFSPDGRYLLITSLLEDSAEWMLYVHDIAENKTQTYPLGEDYFLPTHLYLDWSADRNWLSLVRDGFVQLIAPDYGAERRLIPETLSCSAAVWVNK